jgi:hypothetical protein
MLFTLHRLFPLSIEFFVFPENAFHWQTLRRLTYLKTPAGYKGYNFLAGGRWHEHGISQLVASVAVFGGIPCSALVHQLEFLIFYD